MRRRSRFTLSLAAVAASLLSLASPPVAAKDLPNLDALDRSKPRAAEPPGAALQALVDPGAPLHVDDRLGLPTFVWAARRPGALGASGMTFTAGSPREEQAARRHLIDYAPLYRLTADDVRAATVSMIHNTGRGAVIVTLQQKVDGLEVFRDEMRVIMNQDLELIALSGYLPAVPGPGARRAFVLDAAEAVAAALRDYAGPAAPAIGAADLEKTGPRQDGYEGFALGADASAALNLVLGDAARAKRVLFHLPDALEPAWYVEIQPGPPGTPDSDSYGYVISGADGSVLFRKNLTASDAFSYRVWADTTAPFVPFDGPQGKAGTPHPTGLPDGYQAPFILPNLVTLQNGPISTNDPWLPAGSTQTVGNNADAYVDIDGTNGLTGGDFRATTTSANTFDRTYDTTLAGSASTNQRMASIAQMFFDVNFLHDWFYDAGFNEVSRNAQTSNYGRGGLQGDNLLAEGQDYSGRNNANMSTPADGGHPRMQMYLWDGIGHRALTIALPASIAGDYAVGTAAFGPVSFSTPGVMVLVDDGVAPGSDACTTPFANAGAVNGKIALIDRGSCTFAVKVKNAQVNGAIGVVIANNAATGILDMGGTDATITIPSLFISQSDGALIRAQLGAGVSATLVRDAAVERDGTIDNQIVSHEWGHYISNRLIGNASGLNNNQGGGMGEGWGDFHAMLVTVRSEDALVASNPSWSGTYALAGYVSSGGTNGPLPNTGYYFGIRRYPYSTDLTKNPLTLRHIANGVPLPAGPPLQFGSDGSGNAEVHDAGEVWATMLWECYASLLRDTLGGSPRLTFDQARDRMRGYLVAAYKATPSSPTFLEARDALLAAALAADPNDWRDFVQAFAKRGAGYGAVAPNRASTANEEVTESFQPAVDLVLSGATLSDDLAWCDHDGVLDNGETGRIAITLKNTGGGTYGAATATVTSTNPNVSFPDGGTTSFASIGPNASATAFVKVALNGATGPQALDFNIAFNDPGFQLAGPRNVSFSRRGNIDDVPAQTAADDVESSSPRWTIAGNGSLSTAGPWRRQENTAYDHFWHGPDPMAASDQWLISPVLNVAPSGSFSFTFRHRYLFEFQTSPSVINFDGGVIEISNNGGASWTDIGASASPGYTGALATGANPLGGRNAFVQLSAGFPSFMTTTVSLGAAYQGQNVQIRFRIGADSGADDYGWDIDDIVFSNVTNLPFNALPSDRAICLDSDVDGVIDLNDCAPFNAALWAAPSEALGLDVAPAGALTWSPPAQPGGTSVVYDVLRSDGATAFGSAVCVQTNGSGLTASDPTLPGAIFYYLVRSENGCGGNLGTDSSGAPRTGISCP